MQQAVMHLHATLRLVMRPHVMHRHVTPRHVMHRHVTHRHDQRENCPSERRTVSVSPFATTQGSFLPGIRNYSPRKHFVQ